MFFARYLRLAAPVVIAAAAGIASASSLSLTNGGRPDGRYTYSDLGLYVVATLAYSGAPCPSGVAFPRLQGTLSVFVDGKLQRSNEPFYSAFYRSCSDGQWTAGKDIDLPIPDIGRHEIVAHYTGEPGIAPADASLTIEVVPAFTRAIPGGLGEIGMGFTEVTGASTYAQCRVDTLSVSESSQLAPPDGLRFPYGYVNYRLSCTAYCGGFPECPPFSPFRVRQRMQLQFPAPLPSTATIWAYQPNNENPAPVWQRQPANIQGRLATVVLEGGMYGMDFASRDNVLRGIVAVSIPPAVSSEYDWRGMWWGGPSENGWGLSLSQDVDRLFGVLYVYDDNGKPIWLAMGNGAWDPAKSVYNARLYRPLSPAGDGEIVGTVQLSAQAPGNAMLEYQIGNVHGLRAIAKMESSVPADARVYTGAWDEVPFGGGVTIDGSGNALFIGWPTWLTGDDSTWLLAPGGKWTAANTYEGTLYRTKGSRWIGPGYDAHALEVSPAGAVKIVFSDADNATLSFVVDGVSGARTLARKRF